MAINAQRIDLSQVNSNNYDNILEFQQQRLNAITTLGESVQGLSAGLNQASSTNGFEELEKLVASLTSNVSQYLAENQTSHGELSLAVVDAEKEHQETSKIVGEGDNSITSLQKSRDSGKQTFKACIDKINRYAE